MDAHTQDAVCVSDKAQLTAPPGWTKKLVPASGKSITLRKYDVVFIAPDGQEVKSKWHLNRYLKAHPEGPASSEFSWSSGEEAPIRRSTRFAAKEASEDNKNTSRKKGKRNASEMEGEEMENDEEKTASRKRSKKAGKSAGSDEKNDVKDAENVLENDEVMHEAIACDNEATQDSVFDGVQKDESNHKNLMEVEASNEAITEKAMDEGLDKQVKASNEAITEKAMDEGLDRQVEASNEAITEKAMDEGLDKQGKAEIGEDHEDIQIKDEGLGEQVESEEVIVTSANICGEHEEMQIPVVEVKESFTIDEVHAENEHKAAQDSGTFVVPAEELKVEEIAMETKVMELKEHSDQKFEKNEDVSCKIAVVTSVIEEPAEDNDKPLEPPMQEEEPLEPAEGNDKPLEPPMQEEEPLEPAEGNDKPLEPPMQEEEPLEPAEGNDKPLEASMQEELLEPSVQEEPLELVTQKEDLMELSMQKEGQERPTHIQNSPLTVEHIRDKSPSEFSSSPVSVSVANQ